MYLNDLLNIDNPYFESMVKQIYPPDTDTEAPFLDLHLSIANGVVSYKTYYKRGDFDFDTVNFPFLYGDVPRRAPYGVYISQLIRFARVCNHVADFNARNKCLTAKLLQQSYRYYKLRKTVSNFYRRHYELISKFNVKLKTLLREGLSKPEFYGDLVYKFKKLMGRNDFSFYFRKITTRYRRIGYILNVMRQSVCLVLTQSWFILPSLIARGGSGVRLYDGPDIKLFILVGWGRSFLSVAWPTGVQLVCFFFFFFFYFASELISYLAPRDLHRRAAY